MLIGERYKYYWSGTEIEIDSFYPTKKPEFVRVKYIDDPIKTTCNHEIDYLKKQIELKNLIRC